MKKNDKTQKQNTKTRNENRHTEEQTQEDWIKEAQARSKLMLEEVVEQIEAEHAHRAATFGRWTPIVEALDDVVREASRLAKAAVYDQPRQLAKIDRVRDTALAFLGADTPHAATVADVTDTALLLARLAERDLDLGLGKAHRHIHHDAHGSTPR